MEKTERFSFWLTKEEKTLVVQLAEKEGLSQAALVRRLIRQAAYDNGMLSTTNWISNNNRRFIKPERKSNFYSTEEK